MKKFCFYLCFFLVYALPCYADITGVSDTSLIHNQTSVVITGTGFGGSDGVPTFFEDFESGTVDSTTITGWEVMSGNGVFPSLPHYDDDNNRGKSTKALKFLMTTTYWQEQLVYKDELDAHPKFFYDVWFYETGVTGTYDPLTYQSKTVKFMSSAGYENPDTTYYSLFEWFNGSNQVVTERGTDTGYLTACYVSNIPIRGEWVHYTVMVDLGTQGTADGVFRFYVNNTLSSTPRSTYSVGTNLEAARLWDSGDSAINNVLLKAYIGNRDSSTPDMNEDISIYYDNVYFNDTWQRVEIGDSSTYTNCDHTEVQVPTTWDSDGERVVFTVNQGGLPDGTAYLFVIDEDGTASSGYQITLGGEPISTKLTKRS